MFYEAVDNVDGRTIGLAVSKDGLENWYINFASFCVILC